MRHRKLDPRNLISLTYWKYTVSRTHLQQIGGDCYKWLNKVAQQAMHIMLLNNKNNVYVFQSYWIRLTWINLPFPLKGNGHSKRKRNFYKIEHQSLYYPVTASKSSCRSNVSRLKGMGKKSKPCDLWMRLLALSRSRYLINYFLTSPRSGTFGGYVRGFNMIRKK